MITDVVFKWEVLRQLDAFKLAGARVPPELREKWKNVPFDVLDEIFQDGYLHALGIIGKVYEDR